MSPQGAGRKGWDATGRRTRRDAVWFRTIGAGSRYPWKQGAYTASSSLWGTTMVQIDETNPYEGESSESESGEGNDSTLGQIDETNPYEDQSNESESEEGSDSTLGQIDETNPYEGDSNESESEEH